MHDLPGSLRLTSTFPFVGRTAELDLLRTLMPRAEGEVGRIVLLGGEAGSGKSRLVREFAREAASGGALVLYGACDAVVQMPYGPFVEAFDHVVRVTDPVELRAALGTTGGELARLLPDLPARIGDLPPPVRADPDTERHRLHSAVTDLLAGVSRRRPVLLVLEDGHWADAPTLLLLRHLARAAGSARVLLLATFRDTEADVPGQLSETLADLRRSDEVIRLRLGGLSGEEVTEFVRRAAGGGSGAGLPELGQALRDLTEGNAFLLCESWRALVETGVVEVVDGAIRLTRPLAEVGSPESVREVVSQRLARLEPATIDLLELAATVGAEFEVEIVRHAAGLEEAGLPAALDEAVRSGMIEELPSLTLAYRFTHELVRRALDDRLTGLRRAELHLRVGEALEGADGRSGRGAADLAHHFTAAASLGGAARGVAYNLLAARAATAGLAFDESGDATARRARAAHRAPSGAGGGLPRARDRQPPGRQGTRCAAGVQGGGRHRPRAGGCAPAGSGGDRIRGRMLASGHRRRGRRRAPRGGDRRARRGALAAANPAARWPGAGTRLPGRPPACGRGADERCGDGAADGRPGRTRNAPDALLLGPRDELARGDPRHADRGPRPRRGAR